MRFVLFLMMLLSLFACGKQEGPQNDLPAKVEAATEKLSISGQVFIVTNGRDNIKLALVEVAAIPENDLLQYIKVKHASGIEQKVPLMPAYEASVKEYRAASVATAQAMQRMDRATRIMQNRIETDSIDKSIEKLNAHSASIDIFEKASAREYSKATNMNKLKSKIDHFDSGQYYFEKLPTPLVVSKTDADGRFSLSLPNGKYVIAASTGRKVGASNETYYWLVKIDTTMKNQSLMLSNDNIFGTSCAECIHFEEVATTGINRAGSK